MLLDILLFLLMIQRRPISTLFPYTTLFRSCPRQQCADEKDWIVGYRNSHNPRRSEEHTSELQSRGHLVCRLLLEKKNGSSGDPVTERNPDSLWIRRS